MFIQWFDIFTVFGQMVSVEYSLVKVAKNHKIISKTPVAFPDCSQTKKLDVQDWDNFIAVQNACLSFVEPAIIGRNDNGSNSYLEIAIYPCSQNCLIKPGDPGYEAAMDGWLTTNFNFANIIETVQNSTNYDKPLSVGIGDLYFLYLDRRKISKQKIILKQIVVETEDGLIFKSVKEQTGVVSTQSIFSRKNRFSEDQPIGLYTVELSNKVQIVRRTYPSLLDVMGNVGGMVESLILFIFFFVGFYAGLVLEQVILNNVDGNFSHPQGPGLQSEIMGGSEKLTKQGTDRRVHFSLFQIFVMKFQCCRKKHSTEYEEYTELLELVSQRLDAKQMIENRETASILAQIFFQPYQKRILEQFATKNCTGIKGAEIIPSFKEAVDQLKKNVLEASSSNLTGPWAKLDSNLLRKIIQEEDKIQATNGVENIESKIHQSSLDIIHPRYQSDGN